MLVLVVAAVLRFPFPDLTPFGHDEALEAERARPIWYGARPVDSEITSWFIPDPAGLLYFFALAEPFPKPAIVRVVLVSAANVVSVVLCYLLGRRFFGAGVGVVAGLLYAVNPWAVTFARQPWVITQPLLTTLMLFSAMMVVVRRDRRWIVPFFLAGAAQTQTHLLMVLFGPPVLLTLVLFVRRWLSPLLVPAILGAVAIVAPYLLHLWAIRDTIFEALGRGNRGITLAPDGTAALLTSWLISGYNLDRKLGFDDRWLDLLSAPLLLTAMVASALILLGVAVCARACLRRGHDWQADALLLIWLLAPLALMSFQSSQVYIHYVLCLVPVPFLVMARGAVWLRTMLSSRTERHTGAEVAPPPSPLPTAMERGSQIEAISPSPLRWGGGWGVGLTLVLGAMLLVQALAVVAFYATLDRVASAPPAAVTATEWQQALNRADLKARQLGIGELHGLPLRYWQSVADRTRAAAQAADMRTVTVVSGIQDEGSRHLDRRRKAMSYLLGPDLETRFPLEGLIVVPTAQDTFFLTLPDQELPRVVQRAASRLAEVPQPGTSSTTSLYRVRARPADDVITLRRRANVPVADGVRLVVLDTPPQVQPGQTVPMAAYLQIDRTLPVDGTALVPFVELVTPSTGRHPVVVRGGLDSSEWRPGDLLIQQMSLTAPFDLPDGDYELRLGLVPPDDAGDSPTPTAESVRAATLRVRRE